MDLKHGYIQHGNFIFFGEWVTSKVFFLRFQKNLQIYTINTIKSSTLSCYLDFSLKSKKNIISLSLVQNKYYFVICLSSYLLFIFTPYWYIKKAFYFLGLKIKSIIELKLSRNLFYLIGEEFFISSKDKKPINYVKLYLLNLNEMKFIVLSNLVSMSQNNNLNLNTINDKFLIIHEKYKILIFMYENNFNKVSKFTFCNKRNIFSIAIQGHTLVFGDQDGCFNVLSLSNNKYKGVLYINYLRKLKLDNNPVLIKCIINHFSVLIRFNKKNYILNLYKYKTLSKHCSFFEILGKIFWLRFCPKNLNFMILNENLQFFICNISFYEKKIKIDSSLCFFILGNENRYCFFTRDIRLHQSSVKLNEIFILTGFEKILRTSNSKNNFFGKFKNILIFPMKILPFLIDSIGRQILLTNKNSILKVLNSNSILIDSILKTTILNEMINRDLIIKKEFSFKIKGSISGNKIAVLKKKRLIEIYVQICNMGSFRIQKQLKISFKENCTCFNISKSGKFLVVAYSSIVQIWKLFPKIKKIFSKSFKFTTVPKYINFFSKNEIEKILISTSKELFLYDIIKNDLVYLLKLKIRQITLDKWNYNYIILTDSFFSSNLKHQRSYYIFKKEYPIPIIVLTSVFSNDNHFSSISFVMKNKNSNQKSIVLLDSLLNIYFLNY